MKHFYPNVFTARPWTVRLTGVRGRDRYAQKYVIVSESGEKAARRAAERSDLSEIMIERVKAGSRGNNTETKIKNADTKPAQLELF